MWYCSYVEIARVRQEPIPPKAISILVLALASLSQITSHVLVPSLPANAFKLHMHACHLHRLYFLSTEFYPLILFL